MCRVGYSILLYFAKYFSYIDRKMISRFYIFTQTQCQNRKCDFTTNFEQIAKMKFVKIVFILVTWLFLNISQNYKNILQTLSMRNLVHSRNFKI